MKVILLNGAPRAGKDTVSQILKDAMGWRVHQEKFAHPLKATAPVLYGVSEEQWFHHFDTPEYKDIPADEFFGKTPREVQIAISETLLKPFHDDHFIFSKLLLNRVKKTDVANYDAIVISDSGFREEAIGLINYFGPDNVQLWNIVRDGCDFKNDSRSEINLDDQGVKTVTLYNDGRICDLKLQAVTYYENFILTN